MYAMSSARPIGKMSAAMIRRIGDGMAPRAKGEGRLCIVNYHRVLGAPDPLLDSEPTADTFRWQMEVLATCFNVLPLDEAISCLAHERMPPRAVAITFDDGYRSIHELAMPILREHGLPATVFVTSGHMDDDSSMWNDVILEAVRRLPGGTLDLSDIGMKSYVMDGAEQRKISAGRLTEDCKYLTPLGRQTMLDRLQQLLKADLHQHLMLTQEMIRDLVRNNIQIGGHTVTHPILSRLDDEAAFREIADNKRSLERLTGQPIRLFAYPNGKQGIDFDERHVAMVRAAGYDAAFTTAPGAATRHHHPFKFPRSRPWDRQPLMFAIRLLRWLHGGRHV
jgi:peptidoglycan/xylan/chitin deacetylase (PgdA/CDA1 family)